MVIIGDCLNDLRGKTRLRGGASFWRERVDPDWLRQGSWVEFERTRGQSEEDR